MAGKSRLFSVRSIQLALIKTKPPQLQVIVDGEAVSSGWTDPELVPLEKKLSPDGILDLDFVATPPDKIDMPVLTPERAELVWGDDVDRLVGVRVVARTGAAIKLLDQQAPAAQAQGGPPHLTTLAWGEEAGGGGTMMTTLVVGEEGGGGTTAPWFEEMMPGPVIPPATGPAADAATTLAVGEETTQIAGEGQHPGAPPHLTTLATGEEAGGGGTVFTTFPTGEETTPLLGEGHGGYPPNTTAPLIEETTQMVGEGPQPTTHLLGEEHGGYPPNTTAPLIEETTQMVGEGPQPTTHLLGEEHGGWPPHSLPAAEQATGIAGETWFDPQDMNPLGRR